MRKRIIVLYSFLGWGILIGVMLLAPPAVAPALAQATGDSLPGHTPVAVPSPTATPTLAGVVWTGQLVSNTLGVTEGAGSIFRVSVQGRPGLRIEVRHEDYVMFAESGSKPEYGPTAAEFAPVNKGWWQVSVPALGSACG